MSPRIQQQSLNNNASQISVINDSECSEESAALKRLVSTPGSTYVRAPEKGMTNYRNGPQRVTMDRNGGRFGHNGPPGTAKETE